MSKLEPDANGHFQCLYCSHSLVPILREWMDPPKVTDYICHRCQIGFKINIIKNNKLITNYL